MMTFPVLTVDIIGIRAAYVVKPDYLKKRMKYCEKDELYPETDFIFRHLLPLS